MWLAVELLLLGSLMCVNKDYLQTAEQKGDMVPEALGLEEEVPVNGNIWKEARKRFFIFNHILLGPVAKVLLIFNRCHLYFGVAIELKISFCAYEFKINGVVMTD